MIYYIIFYNQLKNVFGTKRCKNTITLYDVSNNNKTNDDILLLNQYFKRKAIGWNPDYGTSCRGPLPPNSMLRDVNLLSRHEFETLGFDMAWYGHTWEFTNLFWFQVKKCKFYV